MKFPILLLALTAGFFVVNQAHASTGFENLLAPRADGTVDLQGFLNASLNAGSKKIVVPPGRYRLTPSDRVHLRLTKLENIEIVMKGVEIVCTETTQALSITDCKNSKISGLTIDYDPLPFTQARITALGPEKEWMEFEILQAYPDDSLEQRIEIYDSKSEELKINVRYDYQPLEKIGERKYRVRRGPNYKFNPRDISEEVGDFLVTNNNFAPGGQIPHTIASSGNTDMVLEDVTVYASNCMSFLEYHCDNTTYLRCRLDRRPLAEDPVKREWRRMRSGNADAFHSVCAKRGPQIISSQVSYMGDDGVNIRGSYAVVASAEGTTIRLLGKGKPDFRIDDPLEIMTYDGVRLPDGVVVGEPERDGQSTPEIAEFFSRQRMNVSIREALSNPDLEIWKITVREPVSLPVGSVICAKNRIGSGFLLKDSTFGPNRSRGILVKASNGAIIGNTCQGNRGPGILIAPEWWWMEAGSSDDLVISGNTITDCSDHSLIIQAGAGSGEQAPAGAHNRIEVKDNKITTAKLPAVFIGSVKDGSFQKNTLQLSTPGEAVKLVNNENFEVDNNSVTQPDSGTPSK